MTQNTPEPELDDDEAMVVKVQLYPADASEKALRQIGYGINPFILLEVEEGEAGETVFSIVGSMLDSNEEVVELLEGFLDILKAALEQAADEASDG